MQKKIHTRVPARGWQKINLYEIWEHRELLFILAWRDISIRYKQTFLGGLWAVIQPFVTMVIFSIIFGKLAKMPSDNIPYPIFSYTALVPWTFFVNSLNKSSLSLVNSSNLISKVYFPRLILPFSAVIIGTMDFFIAFFILLIMMIFYGIIPTIALIFLPFFILLTLISSLAIGIWVATLNVKFYDLQNALPFIIQAWMFATPIVYPSSLLKEPWRSIYGLNPMSGVIEGFRWALLGTNSFPGAILIVSSITACMLLICGMFYFKRVEHTFADFL